MARLFASIDGSSDSSDDDGDDDKDEETQNRLMDRGAAENRVQNMIDKVDVHLQVEMNILRKWKEKDYENGQKYDTKNWPVVDGTQKPREIGKES